MSPIGNARPNVPMRTTSLYDAIDTYSRQGAIAYVHLRNVRGKVPHYHEVFLDEGDVDIVRALKINNAKSVRRRVYRRPYAALPVCRILACGDGVRHRLHQGDLTDPGRRLDRGRRHMLRQWPPLVPLVSHGTERGQQIGLIIGIPIEQTVVVELRLAWPHDAQGPLSAFIRDTP
jgi:hypothetical protein